MLYLYRLIRYGASLFPYDLIFSYQKKKNAGVYAMSPSLFPYYLIFWPGALPSTFDLPKHQEALYMSLHVQKKKTFFLFSNHAYAYIWLYVLQNVYSIHVQDILYIYLYSIYTVSIRVYLLYVPEYVL